ncbi:hypothetical protein Psch_04026 [Pelotomaculum schinkii]|uniref:DUF4395 domain-containing protein n=1 Tax=Pelotomaculum schinkii TaxID=78350 RepID=A0A4Y7R6Q6_9FIRM|nr:DUF4395 domain-containing protein [Pelotomaculum schinkii]TEB04300.1 hypothetical protein Psch_04026 [Pelotomaculum schinkii]
MAISFSCPVSGEQRDNTTVRVAAGFVFVIAGSALLAALLVSTRAAAIISVILALDFIIREFLKPKYSPLATLARGTVSGLKLPQKLVDSGPKVFAARIGVIFSVLTAILYSANLLYAGSAVLGILLICAALESFLGFCLGCWIYSLLPKKWGCALAQEFTKK